MQKTFKNCPSGKISPNLVTLEGWCPIFYVQTCIIMGVAERKKNYFQTFCSFGKKNDNS